MTKNLPSDSQSDDDSSLVTAQAKPRKHLTIVVVCAIALAIGVLVYSFFIQYCNYQTGIDSVFSSVSSDMPSTVKHGGPCVL